jgi:hypothetical protein
MDGVRVYECSPEGPRPRNGRDAVELLNAAWEHRAGCIAIPVKRLGDDFFRLSSGIAGDVLQKFVTYGMRAAIVGDISRYVAASKSLRDFVYESNRGGHIWFVPNLEELGRRLKRTGGD